MAGTGSDSDVLRRSYSISKLKKDTCLHTWVIEDFSLRVQPSEGFMESNTFTADDGGSKWCLRLYAWCTYSNRPDDVYLHLVLLSKETVAAKCELWIVTADRAKEKRHIKDIRSVASGKSFEQLLGYRNDLLSASRGLTTDDVLTLACEVTVVKGRMFALPCAQIKLLVGPFFKDDFSALFENAALSDLAVVAEDKTFQVHKAILAARSTVFRVMFENPMKEKQDNTIHIKDLSSEVVEEMLKFIYTDAAPNLSSLAEGLLQAAEKYDLKRLKSMCEQQLSSTINADTVVDVFRLADKLNAGHLKNVALSYLNVHFMDVRKSEGWKMMMQEPWCHEYIYDALIETTGSQDSKQAISAT